MNTKLDIDGVKGKCRAFDIGVEECFMGSDDECHRCFEQQDYLWEEKPGKETPCYTCVDGEWKNKCEADQYCDKIDQECKNCDPNAEETEANGCGGKWTNRIVPDDPCAIGRTRFFILRLRCGIGRGYEYPDSCDFESSCDNHDDCFGTTADQCCNDFDECNEDFETDLKEACAVSAETVDEYDGCKALVDCYVEEGSSESHYQPAQANVCCIDN